MQKITKNSALLCDAPEAPRMLAKSYVYVFKIPVGVFRVVERRFFYCCIAFINHSYIHIPSDRTLQGAAMLQGSSEFINSKIRDLIMRPLELKFDRSIWRFANCLISQQSDNLDPVCHECGTPCNVVLRRLTVYWMEQCTLYVWICQYHILKIGVVSLISPHIPQIQNLLTASHPPPHPHPPSPYRTLWRLLCGMLKFIYSD